ncbi:lysophospholipid acyltransferase family protein [Sneathiella limimaris]|uniref:lysophospholipid acyltransferase family protein n=1 Tax=Sneathiella limimaris TaxID=1964213 RepID=UPI00146EEFD8|nr:lysophospholipid acyltransferase family protein [Sneathiella limimaris]
MNQIRAAIVILLIFLWTFVLIPPHLILRKIAPSQKYRLPLLFHKGLCKLLRIKVVVHGKPSEVHPTLFILNHISWLDIPVVGSFLKGSFVAKEEVASYPLVGYAATLQETIFIARTRPSVRNHKDGMQEHLENGDSIFLFPEGTSSNGLVLQDFKSAYFALAEKHIADKPLLVQPVTLAYSRMDKMYMSRNIMKKIAWVGDEELISHVWEFLKSGKVTAELRFHDPVTIDSYDSRKHMAADCQLKIAEGLSRAMTHRPEPK